VHLPRREALEKRVCHAPHFLQFFNPRILSDGKPDEKREMMGNLKEDDIQKLHTTAPEQLTIRNYSSVQFLRQTLPGNALAVGTKSIPGVSSSVTKHTGTGLLQSHDLSGNRQW
jgi:hypothetical protein